jgi:hypothetical protein
VDEESRTADLLLQLVRLRCRRLALWTEHLRRLAPPGMGEHADIARMLDDCSQAAEIDFYNQGEAALLGVQIEASLRDLDADWGWQAIEKAFSLEPEETDFLTLLLAVELEPGFERVIAYLHDDLSLRLATPYLSQRLSGRLAAPFDTSALKRWRLAAPCDPAGDGRLMTSWQADPVVAASLRLGAWFEPVLADFTAHMTLEESLALPCLHPDALSTLRGLPDVRDGELAGAPGIGRQTLVAQFAAGKGRPLLSVDLGTLVDSGVPASEVIARTLRQAAIIGAIVHFRAADAARRVDWDQARRFSVSYIRGVRHPSGDASTIELKPLPLAMRMKLWRALSDDAPPDRLLSQRLTPSEIAQAARRPASPIKARRQGDHALWTSLPTPYEWDDLVLAPAVKAQLRALESQIRLRWSVYEDWGLTRLTHLGHGISALFGGPSGTGKTMAAQVVARALGLELLRVDLAGVVNKYIGETEKRLRELFDACEDSNTVLFFDEADALFGNRTQVREANDRFANIEIDYLLQRIERFDGVAILATNRRQDLDPAFVRRLRFVIEFLPPRVSERLELWQRALFRTAPGGEIIRGEIDWAYLAERLSMTGAEIKSTALNAAFLARTDGVTIGMQHVLAAAQRELAKQGLQLRVPLQERTDA